MKIAMIVERFPPDIGGSGTRFYQIAKRLSKKHMIDVFTLGLDTTENFVPTFNVHRFNSNKPLLPTGQRLSRVTGLTLSTFLQLLTRSYDILDVDIWPIFPLFSVKIAKTRTPTIISWNVVWPFSFNKTISRAAQTFAGLASKLATRNVTVSNMAKTILQNRLSIEPSKIDVIPNGVDEVFSKAKLESCQNRIIFVGRLEPQKRLDLLLRAFQIFRKKASDAELHIIGTGPLNPHLANLTGKIDGLYLHEPIATTDKKELVSQLSKSWVFVSASEFETYGLAIAESLKVGLPAILTRTPYNAAIGEIVKHEHNGLIVEHNQPDAIAKALERLHKDPELWRKLSHNAKQSFFPSWDWVAEKTEAIYKETAKQ